MRKELRAPTPAFHCFNLARITNCRERRILNIPTNVFNNRLIAFLNTERAIKICLRLWDPFLSAFLFVLSKEVSILLLEKEIIVIGLCQ